MGATRVPKSLLLLCTVSCLLLVACSATNKFSAMFSEPVPEPNSSEALGWNTSYQMATNEAAVTGKTMMLWFTGSDWCRYCTMLENEVFHTEEFQAWSAQRIVPVILDFPKKSKLSPELEEQNDDLAEKYKSYIKGYPTALFIDQSGNVIGKLGYESGGAGHWIQKAESILKQSAMIP